MFGVTTGYLLGLESDPISVYPHPADDDLKHALWGDNADRVTDAEVEEVRRFAQFIFERDNCPE